MLHKISHHSPPVALAWALCALCSGAAIAQGSPEAATDAPSQVEVLRDHLKQQERASGHDSAELIPVLSELANAELAEGEKEYAAARLERVVELIRRNEGFYTQSLMTPLLGLGMIYMEAGEFEKAIARLRYAQHLTHRKDGVYSLEQLDLIEQLALAFFAQREIEEAGREKQLAYNLSRRVHGEDAPEHVPGMLRYAAWYRLIGEDRRARRLYHRAIEMLESTHGEEHYSLIEPLTQLSATASQRGYYAKEREEALLRADSILNKQANVDAGDQAASAVRLGDFYTFMQRPEEAAGFYASAWQHLEQEGSTQLDPDALFANPVVMNFPHSFVPDQSRGILIQDREVKVTYEFQVGADGKVSEVEVVDHTGPSTLTRSLRKLAYRLQYRPRIVDGEPVATEKFRFTETLLVGSPMSRAMTMERLAKQIRQIRRELWAKGQAPQERLRRLQRNRARRGG